MIKKIATLAVAAIVLAGSTAFAQTANNTKGQCPKTEQCGKGGHCQKGHHHKGVEGKCQSNEFAGITLTAEQQNKIDALKAEVRNYRQTAANEAKKVEAKGEKVAKEGRAAEMKAKKAEYLKKVKEILTPEQYVVYLENIALSDNAQMGRPRHDMHQKGSKLEKKGDNRGDKKAEKKSDKK